MESTTTYKSVRCGVGDRVRILTSQKAEDPNTYRVESKERNLVHLLCESTNKVVPVHVSRVIRNLDSPEETGQMSNETNPSPDATATATPATKPAKAAKPAKAKVTNASKPKAEKPKRAPLSIKALVATCGDGAERFNKKIETFDHKHMEVRANVLIRGDHRAFVVFNTYDGSLGRKKSNSNGDTAPTFDTVGQVYQLADDAAYEKKLQRLKAEGYVRIPN